MSVFDAIISFLQGGSKPIGGGGLSPSAIKFGNALSPANPIKGDYTSFLTGSKPDTYSPPKISSTPMYDEGSKYREAQSQAALLGQGPSIADIMQQLQKLQDPS